MAWILRRGQRSRRTRMKKMLVLLFVLAAISAWAHAALIQFKLTVASTLPAGAVTVVNQGTGATIGNCTGTTPCTFTIKTGTNVRLTGDVTSQGFGFVVWQTANGSAAGCLNKINKNCDFAITADSSATARVNQILNFRAQVGTGSGMIRVKKFGVTQMECTSTSPGCSATFFKDSPIIIENVAGPLQQFNGYGPRTGTALECLPDRTNCSILLKADSTLVTNFIPIP
jgi:hypothetical protein